MRSHWFRAAWFGRKATFIYVMLHTARRRGGGCCKSLLEKIEDKRRTSSAWFYPRARRHPKCLCVLKHIAGVHKVCLGEYTDTRTRQRRENIMRSTRERRRVAEQENIDKILLLAGDGRGLKSGAVAIFRVLSNCCRTARDGDVTTWRESKSTVSACANFFFLRSLVSSRIVFRVTFWE